MTPRDGSDSIWEYEVLRAQRFIDHMVAAIQSASIVGAASAILLSGLLGIILNTRIQLRVFPQVLVLVAAWGAFLAILLCGLTVCLRTQAKLLPESQPCWGEKEVLNCVRNYVKEAGKLVTIRQRLMIGAASLLLGSVASAVFAAFLRTCGH